ncbi:MAG: START domain-containing protein [Deltaproteobacteria bacterium]|nr:START domain-containing protein [Deltaproteobacteria bacterium]
MTQFSPSENILKSKLISIFIALILILSAFSLKAANWELVKNSNNVKVYTRDVAGFTMKEFRAVTQVKTSLDSIIALMRDVAAYPQWIADCKHASILKTDGPYNFYIYLINGAPFPIQDRDLINHVEISQDQKTKTITMKLDGKPSFIEPKNDMVRVPKLEGFWQFEPLADGIIEITYQVKTDPGGNLPAWLANTTVTESPWKTLTNMTRMLASAKYRQSF